MFLQIILIFKNYALVSISCIKLKKVLQSILGSLGHLFKLSNCKQHLLILVNIFSKEKMFLVSICEPIMLKIWHARNPII
jgi:hypothetical protein